MLNQYFCAHWVEASTLDWLLSTGWRHFGPDFFRYSQYQAQPTEPSFDVMPLRIRLDAFEPARRHRRLLQRNQSLHCRISPAQIRPEQVRLFERHRQRFKSNLPDSLQDFLGANPAEFPCPSLQLELYNPEQQLVAVSFLDVGQHSTSGIYSIFEPSMGSQGLGILLILHSLDYSQRLGKTWYYPGYAYHQASHYDYKKQFAGLEWFDWQQWQRYSTPCQKLFKVSGA